jgi:hypothetical protein
MFVNIDIFAWPDDEAIRARGEAEVRSYETLSENMDLDLIDWPVVVSGPVVDDPGGKYENAALTLHEDFTEWDNVPEIFAAAVSDDPNDMGPSAVYLYQSWMGLRIVDLDDPYLVEHGAEAWSRRLAEPYLATCRTNPNYARVMRTLAFKNGWGRGGFPARIAESWAREEAGLPFLEIEE